MEDTNEKPLDAPSAPDGSETIGAEGVLRYPVTHLLRKAYHDRGMLSESIKARLDVEELYFKLGCLGFGPPTKKETGTSKEGGK